MLYYWLLFFFIAFGSKVLLAFVMIYMLLPADRLCSQCDGDTLLIRMNRTGRLGVAISRGRVQWRWCPRCGWEGLTRQGPGKSFRFRLRPSRTISRRP
jgi:hypothetical protein